MRTCKVIKIRIAQGIPPAPSDALTTADDLRVKHGQPRGTQDTLSSGRSTSPEDAGFEEEGFEAGWSPDCTPIAADDHPSPSSPPGHIETAGYFAYHPSNVGYVGM